MLLVNCTQVQYPTLRTVKGKPPLPYSRFICEPHNDWLVRTITCHTGNCIRQKCVELCFLFLVGLKLCPLHVGMYAHSKLSLYSSAEGHASSQESVQLVQKTLCYIFSIYDCKYLQEPCN